MSDIQELFARDPLELTREDLREIVEKFRQSRAQFNLGHKAAGSTKPPTEKQRRVSEAAAKLNFDLDL